MFTQRQRKILAILKQHKNNITSDEIARLVGVSSRTLRKENKRGDKARGGPAGEH